MQIGKHLMVILAQLGVAFEASISCFAKFLY